jgi:hypothetical protein
MALSQWTAAAASGSPGWTSLCTGKVGGGPHSLTPGSTITWRVPTQRPSCTGESVLDNRILSTALPPILLMAPKLQPQPILLSLWALVPPLEYLAFSYYKWSYMNATWVSLRSPSLAGTRFYEYLPPCFLTPQPYLLWYPWSGRIFPISFRNGQSCHTILEATVLQEPLWLKQGPSWATLKKDFLLLW